MAGALGVVAQAEIAAVATRMSAIRNILLSLSIAGRHLPTSPTTIEKGVSKFVVEGQQSRTREMLQPIWVESLDAAKVSFGWTADTRLRAGDADTPRNRLETHVEDTASPKKAFLKATRLGPSTFNACSYASMSASASPSDRQFICRYRS